MRARSCIHRVRREKAPVAGDGELRPCRFAGMENHLVCRFIHDKAGRAADLLQEIGRSFRLCRQKDFRRPVRFVAADVGKEARLVFRIRIGHEDAVLRLIDGVLAFQRDDEGLQGRIERKAYLGNGKPCIFHERDRGLAHFPALYMKFARFRRLLPGRRLDLRQGVFPGGKAEGRKRVAAADEFRFAAVRRGHPEPRLRQLRIRQGAVPVTHPHAAQRIRRQQGAGLLFVIFRRKCENAGGCDRNAAAVLQAGDVVSSRQGQRHASVRIGRQHRRRFPFLGPGRMADPDHRARKGRQDRIAGVIQALQPGQDRLTAQLFVNQRPFCRSPRFQFGRPDAAFGASDRCGDRLHAHRARCKGAGNRRAAPVALRGLYVPRAVGHRIDRPGQRGTFGVLRLKDQPARFAFKDDRPVFIRMREGLRHVQNAQFRRPLFFHAQTVDPVRHAQLQLAALRTELPQRVAGLPVERQRQALGNRLLPVISGLADAPGRQRIALRRQQRDVGGNLRQLSRRHRHDGPACLVRSDGVRRKAAQQRALRQAQFQLVLSLSQQGGYRPALFVKGVRSEDRAGFFLFQ